MACANPRTWGVWHGKTSNVGNKELFGPILPHGLLFFSADNTEEGKGGSAWRLQQGGDAVSVAGTTSTIIWEGTLISMICMSLFGDKHICMQNSKLWDM